MSLQKFDNSQEALHRLNGSMILHDKRPAVIVGADGVGDRVRLHLSYMPEGSAPVAVFANDRTLSAVFDGLGYFNCSRIGYSPYVMRRPNRGRYRFGLYGENLNIVGNSESAQSSGACNWGRLSTDQWLTNFFSNNYPDVKTVLTQFQKNPMQMQKNDYGELVNNKGVAERAFSRKFALAYDDFREDFVLYYKTNRIGFSGDGERFKILDKYNHLRESLEEKGLRVA